MQQTLPDHEMLAIEAYGTNSISLLDRAIASASEISQVEKANTIDFALNGAVRKNSVDLVKHLITIHGANVSSLPPLTVYGDGHPSIELIALLPSHGWDINARGRDGRQLPFLWLVVADRTLVSWCLAHGASAFPRGQELLRDDVLTSDQRSCPPILERAAEIGVIETFEALRAKGAPMGWRCLHLAAEQTAYQAGYAQRARREGGDTAAPEKAYHERMAMVRHLTDVVRVDVNARDQPAGKVYGGRSGGNALCYVASTWIGDEEIDSKELIWCLLDRGADATAALEIAQKEGYKMFCGAVQEWKERQAEKSGGRCCVQ